jgi:hypothetical protein
VAGEDRVGEWLRAGTPVAEAEGIMCPILAGMVELLMIIMS